MTGRSMHESSVQTGRVATRCSDTLIVLLRLDQRDVPDIGTLAQY